MPKAAAAVWSKVGVSRAPAISPAHAKSASAKSVLDKEADESVRIESDQSPAAPRAFASFISLMLTRGPWSARSPFNLTTGAGDAMMT